MSENTTGEDISYCRECFGKGWNDNWHKISGHYSGGEVFREECESCAGTGLAHPPQSHNNSASREKSRAGACMG